MSIKLGNNNADKIYIDNHPIREILYGDKIRYLRNDYSKNYFDVTNYETSRWEMDNKPNEYVVHLDKYIGSYENVIVPTNMYDTSYHDQTLLTLIKTSGSNGVSIYEDCDEKAYPTCTNLIYNVEMSGTGRNEQTVDITGYPYVYLKCPGSADYGFEDKVLTGATYTSYGINTNYEVVKITPTSNNVTFQFMLD